MRLSTIRTQGGETAALIHNNHVIPLYVINQLIGSSYETDLFALIQTGQTYQLNQWYRAGGNAWLELRLGDMPGVDQVAFAPLYRTPGKILGIGLNYKDHAGDLDTPPPDHYPGSFLKPTTTIIGPGDNIHLPALSEVTTGEAELGVVFGRSCRDIEPGQWLDYVAGFTTILDMTAEDLVRLNPRFLTMAKSFDTFFSFGPELVTPDEIPDVRTLSIATVHNGALHAENVVSNMHFTPDVLTALYSRITGWQPGDILSTGTPRAVRLAPGDTVECRITGFRPLANPVL